MALDFLLGWIAFILLGLIIMSVVGRIADGEWWWQK
jgi:hypothetical protein